MSEDGLTYSGKKAWWSEGWWSSSLRSKLVVPELRRNMRLVDSLRHGYQHSTVRLVQQIQTPKTDTSMVAEAWAPWTSRPSSSTTLPRFESIQVEIDTDGTPPLLPRRFGSLPPLSPLELVRVSEHSNRPRLIGSLLFRSGNAPSLRPAMRWAIRPN